MSSVQIFYSNQIILLTGATGFLGKLLLEKLLRTCCNLQKIYILIRPKKNLSEKQRVETLFIQPCFDHLRSINPNFASKVHLISGDCNLPQLGVNENDQNLLRNEVTCIIHSAANIKFDLDLKAAVLVNVRAVRDILILARNIKKLKSLVYVSTAYSNCPRHNIDEEFYDFKIEPENLISIVENLDDRILETITPHLLGKWPNTYVFSKAAAEKLIQKYKNAFPIGVVRPGIVASAAQEPIDGWIDNFQGLVGVVCGVSLGVLRVLNGNPKMQANVVPADYVVNNIITAGWDVEMQRQTAGSPNITIYNYTGSAKNSITWGEIINGLMDLSLKYPLSSALWYYNFSITPNKFIHKIKTFFLHTLFAKIIDLIFFTVGKPQIAHKKYKKINKLIDSLSYFLLHSWNFSTCNVNNLWMKLDEDDKNLFNFDMDNFNWKRYYENAVIGGRIYLMKDPLETVPRAKRRIYLLALIHYVFLTIVLFSFYKLIKFVFYFIF